MLTVVDDDGNTSTTRVTVRISAAQHNFLADTWWLIAIIVILAANVVYFALEWRRWRGRAEKNAEPEDAEEEPPTRRNTNR
jgi:heme/copper-type cytochrome/quinol oxidase subunit 2